jgi:hypothetical protein
MITSKKWKLALRPLFDLPVPRRRLATKARKDASDHPDSLISNAPDLSPQDGVGLIAGRKAPLEPAVS